MGGGQKIGPPTCRFEGQNHQSNVVEKKIGDEQTAAHRGRTALGGGRGDCGTGRLRTQWVATVLQFHPIPVAWRQPGNVLRRQAKPPAVGG